MFDITAIPTEISVFIGVIGLLWGIFWGIKTYGDQMNAQLFLEFTKRFEEVMESFPKNAWSTRFNSEGIPPRKSKELSLSVLRYLNLCSEEYYLYKKRWLHNEIWEIWEGELIRTLQTPLFIREWQTLASEFESYPKFKEYVDKIQKNLELQ